MKQSRDVIDFSNVNDWSRIILSLWSMKHVLLLYVLCCPFLFLYLTQCNGAIVRDLQHYDIHLGISNEQRCLPALFVRNNLQKVGHLLPSIPGGRRITDVEYRYTTYYTVGQNIADAYRHSGVYRRSPASSFVARERTEGQQQSAVRSPKPEPVTPNT